MMVTFMTSEGHNYILHVNFHKEVELELCPQAFSPEAFSLPAFTIKFMHNIAEENSKEITLETAKLLPFIIEHT